MGDQVVTRRNDAGLSTDQGTTIRNRQSWTVIGVDTDGTIVVSGPDRETVELPPEYVGRHVELGWAVTGYGNQGVTTDHAIAVIEPCSSRAGVYVAMTRGRGRNIAFVVDGTGLADGAEIVAAVVARPENAVTAHAVAAKLGADVLDVAPFDDRIA